MERMTPRVHDLMRLSQSACATIANEAPPWVARAVECAPFAVVRRERFEPGTLGAGIRGREREERYAALVHLRDVESVFTPESLTALPAPRAHAVFDAMHTFSRIAARFGFAWGPTGAAGFELATGVPALNAQSDLDIIVRAQPGDERLRRFAESMRASDVRIDVELAFGDGYGVALEEALRGEMMLFKTPDGPRLTSAETVS
jgi:phosphoribosyl-dephospho-CoA transferase